MVWILQVVILIVFIKFAFDFLNNTTKVANALESIAKSMQRDEPSKAKETEKK